MNFSRTLFLLGALGLQASAAPLPELFNERLKSVVAVEFFIQSEVERRAVSVLGTVIDGQGTVIVPAAAIAPSVAPGQLKEFRVYRPGSTVPAKAEYLGQDAYTGWHFLQAEANIRPELVPITAYAGCPAPVLSEELWGIGLRTKDEDFAPYFLGSRVAVVMKLPQKVAILGTEVAGPGLPVFNAAGQLAGLAQTSFGQSFLLFSRNQHGSPIMLVNVEESSVVLLAEEVLPHLARRPQSVTGRPISWLGAYGLQPMDPEVAKLLQLDNQSGVVLSDILEGSPAALAGLQERDIVLALEGLPLPRLKPDRVVAGHFSQEILRRRPGTPISLAVLRGTERLEVKVTLGDEPKLVREAERHYFERLGFTVREFLTSDGIMHRAKSAEPTGVMVHFVKPGSAAATAGLQPDDWVREIDGEPILSFAQAMTKLHLVEETSNRAEFVLLISRGGETSVLRIKHN